MLIAETVLPTTWQGWGAIGAVAAFAWLVFKMLVKAKDDHIAFLERQLDAEQKQGALWIQEAHKWERQAAESAQNNRVAVTAVKDQAEIVRQVADEGTKK